MKTELITDIMTLKVETCLVLILKFGKIVSTKEQEKKKITTFAQKNKLL